MAKRFISIGGLKKEKVIILPNTKFSISENSKSRYIISKEKDKKIIIAGSIREGEEELIVKSFLDLKEKSMLVIAPRYLKRVNEIINIAKKYDLKYELWTNINECNKILDYEIVILDTIGELTNFYSIGDIAITGGGFKNFGGHNPVEPASFGLPVITGVNMYNFEDTIDRLTKGGGTIKVDYDYNKLYNILKQLLEDDNLRITMGEKNKRVIENYKFSADTTALLIKEILLDKNYMRIIND
jgi:3-deoxy-D-manno-octulosonic-acid transferase